MDSELVAASWLSTFRYPSSTWCLEWLCHMVFGVAFAPEWPIRQCHGLCPAELERRCRRVAGSSCSISCSITQAWGFRIHPRPMCSERQQQLLTELAHANCRRGSSRASIHWHFACQGCHCVEMHGRLSPFCAIKWSLGISEEVVHRQETGASTDSMVLVSEAPHES